MARRHFLRALGGLALGGVLPLPVQASDFWQQPRRLWLQRPASGEVLREFYWVGGNYLPYSYQRLCHLMRDVRANAVASIDPVLLDILFGIQSALASFGVHGPISINSAYRTAQTNERTEGAAKNSLHLLGKAADIRVSGISPEIVAAIANYLRAGGVGVYVSRDFVHVDTGWVKQWRG